MELKIDESYAKNYNEWKNKEDTSKMKKNLKRKIKQYENSSSSDSSDSEDEIETEKTINAYVKKVDQFLKDLEKNGNDITKLKLDCTTKTSEKTEKTAKKAKYKPIFGKDLNIDILLKGGDDDEEYLKTIEEVGNMESKDIIKTAVKVDFASFCDFEGDLFIPAKNPREIEYKEEEEREENKTTGQNCKIDYLLSSESDDEEISENKKDTVTKSNLGRHEYTVRPKDTKRKDKRKEKKERKEREHKETIKKLKNIKLKEMEEKYEKIKLSNPRILKYLTPEDLEEDFDPEKHNKIMERLFEQDDDDDYAVDNEKPVFSDDDGDIYDKYYQSEDDNNVENVNKTKEKKIKEKKVSEVDRDKPESKKRKKSYFVNVEIDEEEKETKKKKSEIFNPSEHGTFKEYIKKYQPVIYDDIIKDSVNGDIVCKFKYRKETPQDFGLTTEEIMFSENKELNKYVSLKKVISIRSQEQEKKDNEIYHSDRKLRKKIEILRSVYDQNYEDERKEKDNVEECLEEDEDDTEKKSKHARKRLRKALKTQKLRNTVSQLEDNDNGTIMNTVVMNDEVETDNNKISSSDCKEGDVENNTVEKSSKIENKNETDKISKKKKKTKSKKSSLPDIMSKRLQSFGVKEGYYMHLKSETKKTDNK